MTYFINGARRDLFALQPRFSGRQGSTAAKSPMQSLPGTRIGAFASLNWIPTSPQMQLRNEQNNSTKDIE